MSLLKGGGSVREPKTLTPPRLATADVPQGAVLGLRLFAVDVSEPRPFFSYPV